MFSKCVICSALLLCLSTHVRADVWGKVGGFVKNPGGTTRDESNREAQQLREARDRAAKEANEVARKLREARDRAAQEAAKVDNLRRQAQEAIARFEKLKKDTEHLETEYKKYEKLAKGNSADLRAEAYNQLRKSGVMGSNKESVKKEINSGLSVVLWAKEFDHAEEIKFGMALAASVASSNPGPALAYVKGFAIETKVEMLKQLKNAPDKIRKQFEAEFEKLLVTALDKAVNHGQLPVLTFGGASVKFGLATYNHWCNVRYETPELVPTSKILGVQLYEVRTHKKQINIPLPNTFQPYVKVEVKVAVR